MSKQNQLEYYRGMFLLRQLDEMLMELKLKDLIMDGYHPTSGQEAIAVGVCSHLTGGDVVLSTHRPQAHSLAKGTTPRQIFAEMLGRRGGTSQGIGGPMQWIDAPNNFFCGSIVGSNTCLATGVGLALKREGKGNICTTFFGDGSTNTGAFHEGMNLASIWKLPVLFVCENNQYGEAMPVREFVSCHPISKRAESYGMPGRTIDGNDIGAVVAAAGEAVESIRKGGGPVFIEMETYRFRGHYGGDPEHTYRSKEEVESWRPKCPVRRQRAALLAGGMAESEIAALEKQVDEQLAADREWALAQRFPTVEEATSHVIIPLH